jgi:myo-inositol-1(or 4)-monophosphatase
MRKELKELIESAGEILREGFFGEKHVDFKGKVDLVTEYDLRIELFLKAGLEKLYPDFEIIGEETSTEYFSKSDKKIYVDPIDGTINFVHSLPFVAISIGFWVDNKPIEGVVYNPILNEFFYAKSGKGAFLNGKKLKVSERKGLQNSLISTGFPYTKVEKGADYLWTIDVFEKILPLTRDVRRYGSASLDLAYIASGRYDGYYELNLKPWDVSAGILLVLEAGGSISNELGRDYSIEKDRAIVASNTVIHNEIIEITSEKPVPVL